MEAHQRVTGSGSSSPEAASPPWRPRSRSTRSREGPRRRARRARAALLVPAAPVGEPFGLAAVRSYALADLAARFRASFTLGALAAVDSHEGVARTEAGATIPFDALLVACGASPAPAVAGAITFRGSQDTPEIERLLDALETGEVRRVTFAVPPERRGACRCTSSR